MFPGKTLCKKESSYFQRSCSTVEVKRETMRTEDTVPRTLDDTNGFSDDSELHPPEEPLKHKQPVRSVGHGFGPDGNFQSRSLTNRMGSYSFQLKSNRRPVTEEEKARAIELANAALNANSFMVVMRPSHVYKGFYMAVPATWARTHLPHRSCKMFLEVKCKAWEVKFLHRESGARLTGGWKKFVMDNNLEEFDVCVFGHIPEIGFPQLLHVTIFRVVDEVTPLSRMTGGASTSWSLDAEHLGSEMRIITNA